MKPSNLTTPADAGPDPIDIEVGLALRRVRLHRGLSQSDLGHAIGVTFQQVQKYERGANRISASMLVRAAKALDVAAAELLPAADAPRMPEALRQSLGQRGAEQLIAAYSQIPSSAQRRALLQLARTMDPAWREEPQDAEAVG